MDDTRRARLAHRIQEELSTLLLKGEIKDHRVNTLISFSFVKLAKDGSVARVGVSSVLEDHVVDSAVAGLNSGAGYLQGRIGRTLKMRQTPRLYFVADHSIEEGQEIINTINELSRGEERNSSTEQTDGD
ncbi:MAG TPA: 30S ribosome-binding factor RbfA [Alkalispirochaeta sp.]|nr:30S ribosome-binding factor RbfA [Alkalispirochaeta sp.]